MSTVAMEEYDLMKDSKYRLYVAAVDKALKNFEYTSEWADLISALGKLNKVLLSYTKFPVIPRRIKISKRLAQCMHPALPSGVHLKALETYDIIFRCMGTNRLAHELFIYSAGLFPLMSHAAMKIRPTLLTIYETHFVPLAERLRPALSGFLSGILPGLDTGTDHFDRTNSLLENVCEGVEPPYFFTCIWQCVANNSPVRLPAISYVLAHYSKKLSMEDQLHLMGNDIGLMVSGLCAAVQDSSVLVQRAALDLLMVCFPMKNQQLLYSDMVRLVTAALTTILRRDMSLNRRLYSWLLGAESTNTPAPHDDDDDLNTTPNPNHIVAYDLLNDALRLILKRCTSETPIDVKPYRLLTSLFDKPQIGPAILDGILYDVFRALYLSCLHQQKQRSANGRCVSFNGDWSSLKHDEGVLSRQFAGRNCQELVKNANLLFDTLQGYYIWSYIEKLFGEAVERATTHERREQRRVHEIGSGPPRILEICILTDFLLDIIPVEAYTASTSDILPSLFTKVVATLKSHLRELNHHEISESLRLCTKILNKLQPISPSQAETPGEAVEEVEEKVLEKSKSDSRINESAEKNELSVEDAARERSYSNQMQKKREKGSPRIEKKAKQKKTKSSPKPSESPPSSPERKEEPVVEAAPRPTRIENKHCVECLEEYKSFFVQFVGAKLIPNTDVPTRFRSLIADKNERTESLRRMLSARLLERPKSEFHAVKLPRVAPLPPNDPSVAESEPTSSTESMTVAANVLLEFSAFPDLPGGEAEAELPAWARALVVVACCEEAARDVQLAAMNTLLEVFDRPGILDAAHVRYVAEHTVALEAMARILWRLLGSSDDQHQLRLCVALLYRLHDAFDAKQFVENVIGAYLTRDAASVHDVKRFFLLWHLGRDRRPKGRDLDRCLLKVLDNLRGEHGPELQLLAESFLAHSLLHNDISRILNPVLTKLLASDTARVGIKHVNVQWQSDAALADDETTETAPAKKVYAISSVNGKIMYHVTEEPGAKPATKKRWFAFAKAGKKDASAGVGERKATGGNASPKAGPKTVKLIVNPLGSKEVYPVGLEGCYSKRESRSSLESLSDSETPPFQEQQPGAGDRDSGFDSLKQRSQSELSSSAKESIAKSLLESMEPISDGIKADAAGGARLPKSRSFDEKFAAAQSGDADSSLVQSWSYCVSDSADLHASHELELSRSAEDFFIAQDEQRDIIDDILNAIVDKVCVARRPTDLDVKPKVTAQPPKNIVLYPIHTHLCLYCEAFDSGQVVYALQTLKSCIAADPHLFIKCLATSGLQDLGNNDVLYQLARHRKSSLGLGFSGPVGGEHVNYYRGYMFLDVVVTVCLHYCRSFYPFPGESPLAAEEMSDNLKIQLHSLDVLDVIVKTLIGMVRDNAKGFSSYIADLLVKCKVQKILLNCLLTSVRSFDEDMTFAEEVLAHNNFRLCDAADRVGEHVEAFQVQLLRLINSLIVLEHDVSEGAPAARIPQQQIFLSAILSALRHHSTRHIHEQWLQMVTACLPYFGDNLKQIAISVVHQICHNVEGVAASYARAQLRGEPCADYAVTQLEALTVLCHYCLLDSSQTVNRSVPAGAAPPHPGEIINNLFNAFFTPSSSEATSSPRQNSDNYRNARKTVLGHMPRIVSSVAKLWQTVVEAAEGEDGGVYGSGKVVKQQLLEFLSPIAVHHGASFVAAVAVAWYERRNPFSSVKTVLPEPNAGQNNLVYLISAIRVIPLDNLVQTVTAVIKNPPPTEGLNADICLEVAVLELFYCYMRNASSSQLSEAWGSLLALVREGCALSPPSQFLLAALLHEIMIKCCPLEERKDQKDLQDVTTKLIDCVSQVCGSCLEQTTWLRRNFAVKEQEEDSAAESNIISGSNSEIFVNSSYSVQAQLVLSEILAPILDICFGSSEKDKVNAILTSLMFNIVPYLKTHTARNMPSFSACSKLLAALSSYQYTRKAWRKEAFDLLLDNAFFQMDFSCLKFWRVIVDNLMTHDNTTFRDLMNRVSMNQSGSLSIFSSREQEYEQKAQLLKRLAYVIFCSETDQYAKYMPDIQEQLTSSLRLSVPGVQAQVFLCFRVILLRMSPLHVTSLWPIIISEMLQVFLQIEQELSTDTEEFSSHIKLMSSLDASWATNSNNGLHALGNPHWLRLQLATAKLLDLALLLPATTLPQFQMYRWAFVGDDLHRPDPPNSFLPHVVRIADLMDRRYADAPTDVLPMKRNEPLLTTNAVSRLRDLHGFFRTLSRCSDRHRGDGGGRFATENDAVSERRPDARTDAVSERIDKVVEMDFLDKIAR